MRVAVIIALPFSQITLSNQSLSHPIKILFEGKHNLNNLYTAIGSRIRHIERSSFSVKKKIPLTCINNVRSLSLSRSAKNLKVK